MKHKLANDLKRENYQFNFFVSAYFRTFRRHITERVLCIFEEYGPNCDNVVFELSMYGWTPRSVFRAVHGFDYFEGR